MSDLDIDFGKSDFEPSESEIAMFEFYKKNPDFACIDLLNQDLAPFQRVIIRSCVENSFVLNILSRGSGKTRMIAMIAAILAMFNPKMRVGFLAPGFRQAKLAFMEFEAIMNEAPHLEACIKRISKQTDMWMVEFHNGAVIFALPLAADNPASIRGTRLHVAMLDEYPHVPKDVIDLVINPMMATQRNPMANVRRIEKEKAILASGGSPVTKSEKNKVLGFSSAYFQFNHMYKTVCDYRQIIKDDLKAGKKPDYAVNVFNYLHAPEGFFDIDAINHSKKTSSEIAFRMEYLSEFPSDSEGFFKRSLIDSCIPKADAEFYIELKPDPAGVYMLGVDPARVNDNFSINILKLINGEMRLVRTISFEQTPLPLVGDYIRRLVVDWKIRMIGMDSGGGGLAMMDILANPATASGPEEVILNMEDEKTIGMRGNRILKMVNFAPNWITDANFEMRASMEHKRLRFPAHFGSNTFLKDEKPTDEMDLALYEYFKMIDELQSIVMTSTPGGVLRFDTPNQHMRKDRYSSLLIAHKIMSDFVKESYAPRELVTGGFLVSGKLDDNEDGKEVVWQDTKIIDDIVMAKAQARNGYNSPSDGALI